MSDLTSGLADVLLTDVAERIQLPMSDYRLAQQHYETLSQHLEREGSELRGRVSQIYPQGSMAIGAVISSKFETDEFDVDAVVELNSTDPKLPPGEVLDALYRSIKGRPGSRYFDKTERRTRCVTVGFDSMHVDLTPMVRLVDRDERTGHIFHAHENEPASKHRHVVANPWGFANWFEDQMPAVRQLIEALRKAADPLPDPKDSKHKSLPLLALQLLKRWRNKCYETREGVRRPPSVMLSLFVASLPGQRSTLLEELRAQCQGLIRLFADCDTRNRPIEAINPRCPEDNFADRWPDPMAEQRRFLTDLRQLSRKLDELASGATLPQCDKILSDLFGERATRLVMESFAKRYENSTFGGNVHQYEKSGAMALGASGLTSNSKPGPTFAVPKSTNFGSPSQ